MIIELLVAVIVYCGYFSGVANNRIDDLVAAHPKRNKLHLQNLVHE